MSLLKFIAAFVFLIQFYFRLVIRSLLFWSFNSVQLCISTPFKNSKCLNHLNKCMGIYKQLIIQATVYILHVKIITLLIKGGADHIYTFAQSLLKFILCRFYLNGKPYFCTASKKKASAVDALLLAAAPRYMIQRCKYH